MDKAWYHLIEKCFTEVVYEVQKWKARLSILTMSLLLMNDAIRYSYNAHFARGCSKALSCVDVCPMKIPTLASIAKMNRGKNGNDS